MPGINKEIRPLDASPRVSLQAPVPKPRRGGLTLEESLQSDERVPVIVAGEHLRTVDTNLGDL